MQLPIWKILDTPFGYDVFDQLLMFSLPVEDQMLLISSDGVHLLDLRAPRDMQDDYDYPAGYGLLYVSEDTVRYHGRTFQLIGPEKGSPISQSDRGEYLHLDLKNALFTIRDDQDHLLFEFLYEDDNSEWGVLSFSPDYQHVLLMLPSDLYILERT